MATGKGASCKIFMAPCSDDAPHSAARQCNLWRCVRLRMARACCHLMVPFWLWKPRSFFPTTPGQHTALNKKRMTWTVNVHGAWLLGDVPKQVPRPETVISEALQSGRLLFRCNSASSKEA